MAQSPTIRGLRLVYRQPLLGLAEVAWRWTFAAAACFLLCSLLLEYMDSLSVTRGDLFLLRSGAPWLVLATLQHILVSGALRFVTASVIVVAAAGALWTVAACAGRTVIIRTLLERHPEDAAKSEPWATHSDLSGRPEPATLPPHWWPLSSSLLALHFLRTGLLMATTFALMGAAVVSAFASSAPHPHPRIALLAIVVLACLVVSFWKLVDWLLAIAPIFAIRDGQSTFDSFSAALDFVRQRSGIIIRSSSLFAILHLAILFVAGSVAWVPLIFIGVFPRLVISALVLLAIVCCACADFLYVAKLAAYVFILETPEADYQTGALNFRPGNRLPPSPGLADEDDILSDIPGLVPPAEPA